MSRKDAEIDRTSPDAILIGAYLFLPASRELRANDGGTTVLPEPSGRVLARLAAKPDEVVPTDALTEATLSEPSATPMSLETCIADIRQTLGDIDHALIESVPGKGYRLHAQPVAQTGEEAPAARPPLPSGTDAKGKPMGGLLALLFVLLLTALVLYLLVWPGSRAAPEAAITPRIALAVEAPGRAPRSGTRPWAS